MDDLRLLREALREAERSRATGGDPFGAVLARADTVLHRSGDRAIALCDPTAHAELAVISSYCRTTGAYDLSDCTLYSAVEPCAMCAGAIHWARIGRVVYAVSQTDLQQVSGGRPKPGCAAILQQLGSRISVEGPLLADEGRALLAPWPAPKSARLATRKAHPATQQAPASITIRPAQPADLDALDALFIEGDAWHAAHEPDVFCVPTGQARPREFLQNLLDDADSAILLADRDGEILGLLMMFVRPAHDLPMLVPRRIGYIDTLIVAERARRQGIGRHLLLAGEDWFHAHDCTDLQLNVWSFNTGAEALYRSLGYRPQCLRLAKRLEDQKTEH